MVNKWNNINKTKETLNSDGQQFHQYQQNELSTLTFTHWTYNKQWHMTLEIQILSWNALSHNTILKFHCGGQIYWWRKLEYPEQLVFFITCSCI
jgi:hypothetical protein